MASATGRKWIRPVILSSLAAALAIAAWFRLQSVEIDPTRIYRIGYADNPPLHFKGEDGFPTGIAVELVREAARRKGIRLEWEQSQWFALRSHRQTIQLRQAQQAKRESEEHFRDLAEAAFEGLMFHDQGVILNANQAFVDLFGFKAAEELVGKEL